MAFWFTGVRRNKTLEIWNDSIAKYSSNFIHKKYESLEDILRITELNTIFQLFIVDVFREIFIQLRSDEITNFSELIVERKHQKTWRVEKKGSGQNILVKEWKSKSIEHTLINGYNWLLKIISLPVGIETMSQGQIQDKPEKLE